MKLVKSVDLDLDDIIGAGAGRLNAALNHTPNDREAAVRARASQHGIRLMKRRSYTERTGDKYWVMIATPMTLTDIERRVLSTATG